MDGPKPDPSTLDAEGDDDVPLSVVKEKQNVDRRESARKASAITPEGDLIGGDPAPAPAPPRPSTTGPTAMQVPPKSDPAPPKATSTRDSLLGLDLLENQPAAPPRPASTTGTAGSGGQSRPDLKQSILSLYATAPRPPQPQPAVQQSSHTPSGSFSGTPSTTGMNQTQSSLGGLSDAFSSLSFTSSPSPKPAHNDAFASLSAFTRPAAQSSGSAFSGLSGGSFFDSKPASSTQPKKSTASPSGWGSPLSATPAPKPAAAPASSALGDLFDLSSPSPAPAQPALSPSTTTASTSVFNLSANQQKPAATTTTTTTTSTTTSNPLSSIGSLSTNAWAENDVLGGNAWAMPDPPKADTEPPQASATSTTNDMGWASLASKPIVPGASGGFVPKVAADEEFGGWTSSTTADTSGTSKPVTGFGGNDDLFSNVWQ